MVGARRYTLSDVRKLCHQTQAEWAEMLNVSPTTIVNWESGKSEPRLSQLRQMSEASGISLDLIFLDSMP